MKFYDVVIIGGGAGLKLVRPALNFGARIAVIEEAQMGGTCLNRGCIPSKMLIHPADVIQQMRENDLYNIHVQGEIKVEVQKLVQFVNQTVDKESQSIYPFYENHKNIDLYSERAHFIAPHTLEVGGTQIQGKKIFIAAGARPYIPSIQGIENVPYWTSTELLRLEELPRSIIIIGGGYVACELGHYLDALGVKVHFVVRGPFMRHLDSSIQQHFQEIFEKRFQVSVMCPTSVSYEQLRFRLSDHEKTIEAEGLLLATGAQSNADTLNLASTGVECDERGFIKVNDHLQTSQQNIYAFGDVIGRCMFRHSANFEGEYLSDQHFNCPSNQHPIVYPPVPYGVFTWPQIAGVGKTESELQKDGISYIVGLNPYAKSAMGMALRKDEGFVKLLFEAQTRQLLGGHIIGEQATTMVHMIIAYMNMGATLDDLLRTIYIHPALPEIIRNAARRAQAEWEKRQ